MSAVDDNIVVRIFDSALNYIKTDVIDAVANQTVEPSITVFGNGNYVVSYTLFNSASDSDIVARVVNSATGVVGRQFDIDNQTDNRHVSQLATLSNGTSWRSIRTRLLAAQRTPTSCIESSPRPARR